MPLVAVELLPGECAGDNRLDVVEMAASTILANTLMNFDEAVIKR